MLISIKTFLLTSLRLLPVVARGYLTLFGKLFYYAANYWNNKKLADKIFSLMLFFQVVFSVTGWLGYFMDFGDGPELISASVKPNIYFMFFSLVNFIIMEFRIRALFLLFVLLQSIMFVIAGTGYLFQNPVFTDFLDANDYSIRFTFYLFFILLLGNTYLGFNSLKKK